MNYGFVVALCVIGVLAAVRIFHKHNIWLFAESTLMFITACLFVFYIDTVTGFPVDHPPPLNSKILAIEMLDQHIDLWVFDTTNEDMRAYSVDNSPENKQGFAKAKAALQDGKEVYYVGKESTEKDKNKKTKGNISEEGNDLYDVPFLKIESPKAEDYKKKEY